MPFLKNVMLPVPGYLTPMK